MRILIVIGWSMAAVLAAQQRGVGRVAADAAAAADRSTPVLSVPVMGLIAGAGPAEVRPLVGLPGSAITGDALRLPDHVRRVHLAPGQASALVERTGATIAVIAFDGASAGEAAEVAGAMARPDLVGFSPSGGWAVLHSAQGARMQVIALSGGAARVTADFASDGIAGVRQVAIDDAGAIAVAVTDDGGVYVVGNRPPQLILQGGTITDVGFVAGKPALLVADAAAGRITWIDGLPDRAAARVVGIGIENDGQVWVRSSTDGKYAFAAGSGRRTAWRIDVATGAVRGVDLPEDAAGLVRLGNGNTFVYSSAAGGPVWLLLGDDPELRTVFAPGVEMGVRRGGVR